jgi:hypothetical protein
MRRDYAIFSMLEMQCSIQSKTLTDYYTKPCNTFKTLPAIPVSVYKSTRERTSECDRHQ